MTRLWPASMPPSPKLQENTMTEQRIDEIVDELVKTGRLLWLCNKLNEFDLQDIYCAKIKAYREELKQLLKE